MPTLKDLCKRLGYEFRDIALLETALTHRSYDVHHNERLEFLGDSVLSLVLTEYLFTAYPNMAEGELSRLRSNLVNSDTLARLAKEMFLNDHIKMGLGELHSGGQQRTSILADAVEALIGAVYLDAGLAICKDRVLTWWAQEIAHIAACGVQKDPKTLLQEYAQGHKLPLPKYTVLTTAGKNHVREYQVECKVPFLDLSALGRGTSKRRAEQDAAQHLLILLGQA